MRQVAKDLLRGLLRKAGYDVVNHRYRAKELGYDYADDLKRFLPRNQGAIIFDVGANEGQSVRQYKGIAPDSIIHSFEPSPATFQKLVANTRSYHDLRLNNVALGSACGTQTLLEQGSSVMSSFLKPAASYGGEITRETPVSVTTLDTYCRENGIPAINLLKIDAQGFDYEILKGAQTLLTEGRIQLIMTEMIFSHMYEGLPAVDDVMRYLLNKNLKLVSFYDLAFHDDCLSWLNAMWVNPRFAP